MSLPHFAVPERKVPVIVRDAYTVFLERTSGITFVHCDIHARWSPSVKERLVRDWRSFRELHDANIFALHDPGDTKHHKFLTLFGFRHWTCFEDAVTEAERHLYIHTGA